MSGRQDDWPLLWFRLLGRGGYYLLSQRGLPPPYVGYIIEVSRHHHNGRTSLLPDICNEWNAGADAAVVSVTRLKDINNTNSNSDRLDYQNNQIDYSLGNEL